MTSRSELSGKQTLRRRARQRRAAHGAALGGAARARAGEAACGHLERIVATAGHRMVSAYWPLDDEFDARPIMHFFHRADCAVGLPVVAGRAKPLLFRRWTPDMALVKADFNVMVPPADGEAIVPGLMFVPLLAFDRRGFRLGYGGGYYDRTIAALSQAGRAPLCIGLAFAMQEVAAVPAGPQDRRLDWIVTEKEAIAIAGDEV